MPVGESEGRSGVKRGEDRNEPLHSRGISNLIRYRIDFKNQIAK